MIGGLLGRKLGMTQVYLPDGALVPCTVIEVGPCSVVQIRTRDRDGYDAVQVGFLPKARGTNKPLRGHFAMHNVQPVRHLREFKVTGDNPLTEGQTLTVAIFHEGDRVDVTGITKGRGFSGVVRRYGFAGSPSAHGSHETFRGPGSVGSAAHPSHTPKGKRLAGHYGVDRKTIQNLRVVRVDEERNLLLVKGAIPGSRGGLVEVRTRT